MRPGLCAVSEASPGGSRCRGVLVVTVLAAVACSGVTSCSRTEIVLSTTAIAAVVVGTTVGVTYAVKHHNHTLQGCVFSGGSGLKLRTSEAKVYTLRGDTDRIKVGDSQRLHGSKVKKAKGDPDGDPVFAVQKVNKDYGPCAASGAPSPAAAF